MRLHGSKQEAGWVLFLGVFALMVGTCLGGVSPDGVQEGPDAIEPLGARPEECPVGLDCGDAVPGLPLKFEVIMTEHGPAIIMQRTDDEYVFWAATPTRQGRSIVYVETQSPDWRWPAANVALKSPKPGDCVRPSGESGVDLPCENRICSISYSGCLGCAALKLARDMEEDAKKIRLIGDPITHDESIRKWSVEVNACAKKYR